MNHLLSLLLCFALGPAAIAAEFKARYLVLHMGSVPMSPKKWTRPLTTTVAEGGQHSADYIKRKLAFVKKREKIGPLYLHRAIEALTTIAERAAEVGVKLAVESRSRLAAASCEESGVSGQPCSSTTKAA